MKYENILPVASLIIGLSWASGAVVAAEPDRIAALENQFERVCLQHGGDFQHGWRYYTEGKAWDKRITCAAGSIKMTCEGIYCAAARRLIPGGRPAAGRNARTTGVLTFIAVITTFDEILATRAYE